MLSTVTMTVIFHYYCYILAKSPEKRKIKPWVTTETPHLLQRLRDPLHQFSALPPILPPLSCPLSFQTHLLTIMDNALYWALFQILGTEGWVEFFNDLWMICLLDLSEYNTSCLFKEYLPIGGLLIDWKHFLGEKLSLDGGEVKWSAGCLSDGNDCSRKLRTGTALTERWTPCLSTWCWKDERTQTPCDTGHSS